MQDINDSGLWLWNRLILILIKWRSFFSLTNPILTTTITPSYVDYASLWYTTDNATYFNSLFVLTVLSKFWLVSEIFYSICSGTYFCRFHLDRHQYCSTLIPYVYKNAHSHPPFSHFGVLVLTNLVFRHCKTVAVSALLYSSIHI